MKKEILFFMLVITIFVVSGCGTTMHAVKLDQKTARFPTGSTVKPKEILTKENISMAQYKKLLYVRSESFGNIKILDFQKFIHDSFKNLTYFDSVMDKREMEAFVVSKGLADSVTSVSELPGLYQLQKRVGNFLVLDYSLKWLGGYNYEFEVTILDPSNGKTVLHICHKAFNLAGLDEPLFYPVFNSIKDWIDDNS